MKEPREEALAAGAVDAWLKERVAGLAGEPEVTRFRGGASNWTYRLRYPSHDFVLRRPPAGTRAKSSHDMRREYEIQLALAPYFPYLPEMVAWCGDASVAGAEFYVMQRVEGMVPRWPLPAGLELPPQPARALAFAWIDRLVDLHRVDPEAAGLAAWGKGPGYARRQIEGWCDRYERARTWNAPRLASVGRWLRANVPDDVATVLVHNDYRLDNLIVDPESPATIRAVLDWEMATLGDPWMDLGAALAYWIEPGDGWLARRTKRQPTDLPGMPTRAELASRYTERSGRPAVRLEFYEVYGLYRLAAIAQQIYFRYHRGESTNRAFRHFWILPHHLGARCRRILRSAPG